MNQTEHVETARELASRADDGTGTVGKHLVAAEFLQGVFAHCPITVALNDGLPHDGHGVQPWSFPESRPASGQCPRPQRM